MAHLRAGGTSVEGDLPVGGCRICTHRGASVEGWFVCWGGMSVGCFAPDFAFF